MLNTCLLPVGKIPPEPKQNNEDLYQRFLQDLPELQKQLTTAFDMGHYKSLADTVHQINGASRYLKLDALTKICNSLEASIHDKFPEEEIKALYAELCKALQDLLNVV